MTRQPKNSEASPFLTLQLSQSEQSLYRGLYESLREAILTKRIAANAKLPSTRALSAQLGVSRTTVVNAYEQLLAEGYITGKIGAGTFVAAALPEDSLETRKNGVWQVNNVPHAEQPRHDELSAHGKRLLAARAAQMQIPPSSVQKTTLKAFRHGLPALDQFPYEVWARLVARRWRKPTRELLSYGSSAGYSPLRWVIAAYLKAARAVNCEPEQVIIVAGAQQAIDLTMRVLLDANDCVWLEDPCYRGAKNAFAAAGARIVGVPIDAQGFDLNKAIKSSVQAKLVYVTPSHQFPLGVTMSLNRRLELLEWAKQNRAWIVEDDYDSEYRYAGRPLAALQGLDRAGRTIYMGTFSKTVFPALRLGCLVVPPDLVDVFAAARRFADFHSPAIDQAVLTDFIHEGHFAKHVRRMRSLYKERQEILVLEAQRELKGLLNVSPSPAGMHLVGWLPDKVCDKTAAMKAAERGVQVAPLSAYRVNEQCNHGLLLGYAHVNETEIKSGVRHLAAALSASIINDGEVKL
jgi:GntR family transcriptional regulator/MocR family aminotransferase